MSFATALALADRAALDHLGGPVIYTPGTGAAVSVTGIFDAVYYRANPGKPGVIDASPAVFLLLADLPSDPAIDSAARLTIGGTSYKVREPCKDGTGGVLLLLHEA